MTYRGGFQKLAELCIAKGCIENQGEEAFYPIPIAVDTFDTSESFYDSLGSLQVIIQKLLAKIEKDDKIIDHILQLAGNDEYLTFLGEVRSKTTHISQKANSLTLCRCDYFLNGASQQPQLIEYNNMQVGMLSYSNKFSTSHQLWTKQNRSSYFSNETTKKFVACVAEHYRVRNLQGLFIFVISSNEGETLTEQMDIELGLIEQGIETRRVKYREIVDHGQVDQNGDLYIDGELVSFAYFRSGFLMKEYKEVGPIEDAIEARAMLAGSNTTCVPSLNMEILNTKVAQSYITRPDILRAFLSESECEQLEKTLVQSHILKNASAEQISNLITKVKSTPNGWVLKPNMQGGRNNLYGQQVLRKLEQFEKEGGQNFILMKLIENIPFYNNHTIFMGKKLIRIKCNYEISRYGLISEIEGTVVGNFAEGYLIRTREEGKNQSDYYHGHDSYVVWRKKKQ